MPTFNSIHRGPSVRRGRGDSHADAAALSVADIAELGMRDEDSSSDDDESEEWEETAETEDEAEENDEEEDARDIPDDLRTFRKLPFAIRMRQFTDEAAGHEALIVDLIEEALDAPSYYDDVDGLVAAGCGDGDDCCDSDGEDGDSTSSAGSAAPRRAVPPLIALLLDAKGCSIESIEEGLLLSSAAENNDDGEATATDSDRGGGAAGCQLKTLADTHAAAAAPTHRRRLLQHRMLNDSLYSFTPLMVAISQIGAAVREQKMRRRDRFESIAAFLLDHPLLMGVGGGGGDGGGNTEEKEGAHYNGSGGEDGGVGVFAQSYRGDTALSVAIANGASLALIKRIVERASSSLSSTLSPSSSLSQQGEAHRSLRAEWLLTLPRFSLRHATGEAKRRREARMGQRMAPSSSPTPSSPSPPPPSSSSPFFPHPSSSSSASCSPFTPLMLALKCGREEAVVDYLTEECGLGVGPALSLADAVTMIGCSTRGGGERCLALVKAAVEDRDEDVNQLIPYGDGGGGGGGGDSSSVTLNRYYRRRAPSSSSDYEDDEDGSDDDDDDDRHRLTALHIAVRRGNVEVVRYLLSLLPTTAPLPSSAVMPTEPNRCSRPILDLNPLPQSRRSRKDLLLPSMPPPLSPSYSCSSSSDVDDAEAKESAPLLSTAATMLIDAIGLYSDSKAATQQNRLFDDGDGGKADDAAAAFCHGNDVGDSAAECSVGMRCFEIIRLLVMAGRGQGGDAEEEEEEAEGRSVADDGSITDTTNANPNSSTNAVPSRRRQRIIGVTCLDLDYKTEYGDTALHLATTERLVDVIELLLANGANVNILDGDGSPPIFYSCREASVTRALMREGGVGGARYRRIVGSSPSSSPPPSLSSPFPSSSAIDYNIRNFHGQTLLDFIYSYKKESEAVEMGRLFIQRMSADTINGLDVLDGDDGEKGKKPTTSAPVGPFLPSSSAFASSPQLILDDDSASDAPTAAFIFKALSFMKGYRGRAMFEALLAKRIAPVAPSVTATAAAICICDPSGDADHACGGGGGNADKVMECAGMDFTSVRNRNGRVPFEVLMSFALRRQGGTAKGGHSLSTTSTTTRMPSMGLQGLGQGGWQRPATAAKPPLPPPPPPPTVVYAISYQSLCAARQLVAHHEMYVVGRNSSYSFSPSHSPLSSSSYAVLFPLLYLRLVFAEFASNYEPRAAISGGGVAGGGSVRCSDSEEAEGADNGPNADGEVRGRGGIWACAASPFVAAFDALLTRTLAVESSSASSLLREHLPAACVDLLSMLFSNGIEGVYFGGGGAAAVISGEEEEGCDMALVHLVAYLLRRGLVALETPIPLTHHSSGIAQHSPHSSSAASPLFSLMSSAAGGAASGRLHQHGTTANIKSSKNTNDDTLLKAFAMRFVTAPHNRTSLFSPMSPSGRRGAEGGLVGRHRWAGPAASAAADGVGNTVGATAAAITATVSSAWRVVDGEDHNESRFRSFSAAVRALIGVILDCGGDPFTEACGLMGALVDVPVASAGGGGLRGVFQHFTTAERVALLQPFYDAGLGTDSSQLVFAATTACVSAAAAPSLCSFTNMLSRYVSREMQMLAWEESRAADSSGAEEGEDDGDERDDPPSIGAGVAGGETLRNILMANTPDGVVLYGRFLSLFAGCGFFPK